jgi:[acyl-carrier-protein] S-malonyltransferase
MAAVIGLPPDAVAAACAEAAGASGEVVSAANFNSPEQTVIAGTAAGVARAGEILKAQGARRVLPLPVSAPFHCALMKGAEEALAPFLASTSFAPLAIPVVNNADANVETDAAAARDALLRQVCSPVRWVESVQRLSGMAASAIEVGPGTVLSGLARRIAKDWPVKTTSTAAALDALA